tara:strand:- start:2843 stop:3118 length:276 start_codon:yes stop_codon:yes gene_type:complete
MDETDLLLAEARLGLQTQEFLKSPVGKFIAGRALKAKQEAFEAWVNVEPCDEDAIRELQFRARLPQIIISWLDEAINQAQHAEETLNELRE